MRRLGLVAAGLGALLGCEPRHRSAVYVDTSVGRFTVYVREDAAPEAAEAFLALAETGGYDGAPLLTEGDVLRTTLGDPSGGPEWVETDGFGLAAYAVGLVRDPDDPGRATSDWFVQRVDAPDAPGMVLGSVLEGTEVVDALAPGWFYGGYGYAPTDATITGTTVFR